MNKVRNIITRRKALAFHTYNILTIIKMFFTLKIYKYKKNFPFAFYYEDLDNKPYWYKRIDTHNDYHYVDLYSN